MKDDFNQVVIAFFIGIFVSSIFVLALFTDDYKELRDDYCVNVAIWESDAEAGINPYDRAGHPNYKEVSCEQ